MPKTTPAKPAPRPRGRPRKLDTNPRFPAPIKVYADDNLRIRVKAAALKDGVSEAEYSRQAIEQRLEREGR